MNWRNAKTEKPVDGQDCLTKMKHGIIQGFYSEDDSSFHRYYFGDIEWNANEWVPIEEATKEDM